MISIFFMLIAGFFNAVMDKVNFNFTKSIFKNLNPLFWDLRKSWKNQWQQPMVPPYSYWYYFGLYKPRYQEKFPYSSTFLVFLADAWHLAKALMLLCISLAIVFYQPIFGFWIDAILYYVSFTVTFTYFFEYILASKTKKS